MRIQKPGPESRHEITSSKGATADKTDRFSKILEEKRNESRPQFNLLANGEASALPRAAGRPENISSPPESADIERLASEIVDHISSHQTDGVRAIEIQFNSRTLEGLRVSVRSEQGPVKINFLTPVARIGTLVQKNLETLRSALESKGVRVAHLAVNR